MGIKNTSEVPSEKNMTLYSLIGVLLNDVLTYYTCMLIFTS